MRSPNLYLLGVLARKLPRVFSLVCLGSAWAVMPQIEQIESTATDEIQIEFITEPNLVYELQVTTDLSSMEDSWNTVFVAPSRAAVIQYFVVQPKTEEVHFYRLRVTTPEGSTPTNQERVENVIRWLRAQPVKGT